jgi:hypothetical protein
VASPHLHLEEVMSDTPGPTRGKTGGNMAEMKDSPLEKAAIRWCKHHEWILAKERGPLRRILLSHKDEMLMRFCALHAKAKKKGTK